MMRKRKPILPVLTILFSFSTFGRAQDPAPDEPGRGIHFSVIPCFSAGNPENPDTPISLNVVLGVTEGISGLQAGTGIGVVRRDSKGVQFSLLGNIGEESFSGLQTSGVFSALKGTLEGVQISPVFNITGDHVFGLQFGGLVNWSGGDLLGVQTAGMLNTARDVYGLQAGLINIADDVEGVQIGLINISDSMDGIPLGIVNLSANGYSGLSFWYDTNAFLWSGIQSGSRHAYSILFGGMLPGAGLNASSVIAGFGMGLHGSIGPFFIDGDFSMKARIASSAGIPGDGAVFPSVRIVAGGEKDRLGVFGGVTIDAVPERTPSGRPEVRLNLFGNPVVLTPAYFFGIRL